jgi:hypothetical protein
MPVCMYNRGGVACDHRKGRENKCAWPLTLAKPTRIMLFKLRAGVQQTDERDIERIRVIDLLGINKATSCDASTWGALLRIALLKTIQNTMGKLVYDRDVFFCSCHVHPDDITVGQREGSFSLVDNFRILGTVEMQRLPNSPVTVSFRPQFIQPKLRHASPLAVTLSTANEELSVMLQRKHQTFKVIESNFESMETDFKRINEQLSDEVRILRSEIVELRTNINAIDNAARKIFYQLDTEAQLVGESLTWSLDTLHAIYTHANVKVKLYMYICVFVCIVCIYVYMQFIIKIKINI